MATLAPPVTKNARNTEPSHADALITTAELAAAVKDRSVRLLEVDYEPTSAYAIGHIESAQLVDWRKDVTDPIRRDFIDRAGFEQLLSRLGVQADDDVVLYGDFRGWFAAFAFWVFKIYGHEKVRILDGSRKAWLEAKLPLTTDTPRLKPTPYRVRAVDVTLRAHLPQIVNLLPRVGSDVALVDVRTPAEYRGEASAPPEYANESSQRAGHIPGAINIQWSHVLQDDDTFKPEAELRRLYAEHGVTPDKSVIAYCRIGERSSHTWFVLKHLLHYPVVQNYDGSWSEWGNTVGVPIQTQPTPGPPP